MAAALIPSGPASALATALNDFFAWVINGGSAWTRSVCTVIASVVPSALVMLPRTAGTGIVVSRQLIGLGPVDGAFHGLELD